MTTTIEYEAFIADTYPAEQVDQVGYARLRDKARNLQLQLVGDVTRVYEAPAVSIPVKLSDGTETIECVDPSDPRAAGRTPDAKQVRWEIQVEPFAAIEAVKVAAVVVADSMLARAEMPPEVTDQGALVELTHSLGGEVTVLAFNATGEPVGYTYGVPIDDDTHELMLPPGVQRLEATRDPDEDEEGTQ